MTAASTVACPAETEAQMMAQAGSLSQGLLAEGSLRRFTFSVDLQHFQAGPRLPLNLATVVLELELPQGLAGMIQQSIGRLPPRLAPLRTQAIPVARGSEAALSGGQAACEFTAGLMSMATLLARGLVMTVDVYHKERLADDLLLGRAHVPLAPLLQESWVDGRAGVFALVPSAADPAQHERVQVGTVHLVMSLEEVGPAVEAPSAAPGSLLEQPATMVQPASATAEGARSSSSVSNNANSSSSPLSVDQHATGEAPGAAAAASSQSAQQLEQRRAADPPQAGAHPPAMSSVAAAPALAAHGAAVELSGGAELEAAWEVELWKREQQAKWIQELKEREARRMAALEETWRRREHERDAEATALRSEYAALEAKARQVLASAEAREQKLVAAEEAVARRRRELEREHAGRVAEAEAAVRRLQAECHHQLELEQQRREQLQQQRGAAEQRAAAAEARAAAADKALVQQREQHGASEAGQLESELAAARQDLAHAEQRLAKAAEAKRKYKEQVVRLAREVALLQQQVAELVGVKRAQLGAEMAKLQAEEAALAAARDAAEMSALKQRLHSLQVSSGSTAAVAGSPGAAVSAATSSGGGKENGKGGGVVLQGELCEAVQRLLRERELLLNSGAYSPDDTLIRQLDGRIRECAALARPV